MSQFRMRTSSASKSTQTESNVEQGNVDNGEDDVTDAVLPENDDLKNDDPKLSTQIRLKMPLQMSQSTVVL